MNACDPTSSNTVVRPVSQANLRRARRHADERSAPADTFARLGVPSTADGCEENVITGRRRGRVEDAQTGLTSRGRERWPRSRTARHRWRSGRHDGEAVAHRECRRESGNAVVEPAGVTVSAGVKAFTLLQTKLVPNAMLLPPFSAVPAWSRLSVVVALMRRTVALVNARLV
jgi:hypothetical protein